MRPPGIYFDIQRSEYDADPGLNQSLLKKFAKASTPFHFKHAVENPKPATDAMNKGNAVEALFESADQFHERFITEPATYPAPANHDSVKKGLIKEGDPLDWHNGAKWCKAWAASAASSGKTIISRDDLNDVRGMVHAIECHSEAKALLEYSRRQVMIIANHPTGFRMKALLDMLPDEGSKWIYDLKTSVSANPRLFWKIAWDKGYDIQAAFYVDACRLVGIPAENFGFLVVENTKPHCIDLHFMNVEQDEFTQARAAYVEAAEGLSRCLRDNQWPAYSPQWKRIKFKQWMMTETEVETTI